MTSSLIRTFVLSSTALLTAAGSLTAQTLHTKTGEVLIGRVVSVDDTSVKIELGYPSAGERTVARADLLPVSVGDAIFATTPAKNAFAWKKAGDACGAAGLPAQAIACYAVFGKMGNKADVAKRLTAKVHLECAKSLMGELKEAEKAGDAGRAHLLASLVAEQFADTGPAAGAKKAAERLAARVAKKLEGSAAEGDKLTKATEAASKLLEQAKAALDGTPSTAAHYDAADALTTAWSRVGSLSNAGPVRDQVKAALIGEHAALAQVALRAHDASKVLAHAGAIRELDPTDKRAAQLGSAALQVWMTTGLPKAE